MHRNTILGHAMLSKILPIALATPSRIESDPGTSPITVALCSDEDNFEPVVLVAIILEEEIRAGTRTSTVANEHIQKSVVVVVNKGPIAASYPPSLPVTPTDAATLLKVPFPLFRKSRFGAEPFTIYRSTKPSLS